MIGPRAGASAGPATGLRAGESKDETLIGWYPKTAAAMRAAVGFGTWSAGWLCDEASGSLVPAFGSGTLAAAGTPTYGNAGLLSSTDKAVGFNSSDAALNGGDIFNVDATSDICVAWVGKFSGLPAGNRMIISKYTGWFILALTDGSMWLDLFDTGDHVASVAGAQFAGQWHIGMCVGERGAGVDRIGTLAMDGSSAIGATTSIAALGDTTNHASPFHFGAQSTDAPIEFLLAAAYVGVGVGAAANMSTNLSTALSNFKRSLFR